MKDFFTNLVIGMLLYILILFIVAVLIIVFYTVYCALIVGTYLPLFVLTIGVITSILLILSIVSISKFGNHSDLYLEGEFNPKLHKV
jgi:cytochrome c biogenesis protein CcdA